MSSIFKTFLIVFFLNISPVCADLASDTLYLTWKQSPTTTMTMQWISPIEEPDVFIYFRSDDEKEWQKEKGVFYRFPQNPPHLIARVELLNLKPDTLYVFKQNDSPKEYRFRTMPSQMDKPIRFVVGGDMYHDGIDLLTETSKQAAKFNPMFAVLGGDIAYASHILAQVPQRVNRWVDWIKDWHTNMVTEDGRMIPVIAAVGNHDVSGEYDQTPAQAAIFSLLFPMPGPSIYNVIDFGNYLSLVLLDSGHANPVGGAQTEWLKGVLKQRQHIPNRFAVYHVPAYTSVRAFNNRRSLEVRKYWVPVFEQCGIQTAFEHHDHAYKRTFPILNNKIDPKGVVYIGDGAWGVEKTRNPKKRGKRFYIEKFASTRNFIGVILQPNQQVFLAIDPKGNLIDEFIRKKETEKEQNLIHSDITNGVAESQNNPHPLK